MVLLLHLLFQTHVKVNSSEIKEILQKTGLRFTRQRADVLSIFENKKEALTQADIEKDLPESFDRITLYRILRSLEAHGILHKVLDDGGTSRFALCGHTCTEKKHQHEHVHFKCTSCEKIQCLEDTGIPAIRLPDGFVFGEAKLLVEGICKDCSSK